MNQDTSEEIPFFNETINRIRENFEQYKASHSSLTDSYLKCKPTFLQKIFDKRFKQFYQDQETIYKHGRIVWGHIIQANQALFDSGKGDYPAAIIYSEDTAIDAKPYILEDAAHSLFDIKGADTDPELSEFARKLADEMEADWKLRIPPQITSGVQCFYLTNMTFRKHLPDGYLAASLFPILICPEKTDVGFILPSKFWTPEFITEFWK